MPGSLSRNEKVQKSKMSKSANKFSEIEKLSRMKELLQIIISSLLLFLHLELK